MEKLDTLYECLMCGNQEVVKRYDHRIDGRSCEVCKGHITPLGRIGAEIPVKEDGTFAVRKTLIFKTR